MTLSMAGVTELENINILSDSPEGEGGVDVEINVSEREKLNLEGKAFFSDGASALFKNDRRVERLMLSYLLGFIWKSMLCRFA